MTLRRTALTFLAVAALTATSACGDDGGATDDTEPVESTTTSETTTSEATTTTTAPEATTTSAAPGGDAAVSEQSAACVSGLGYEVAEAGATDLPIADADGEGLPIVDGSPGIGIRGSTDSAVFYVYDSDAAATAAYQASIDNPDIDLVAPRVDSIAIDNVFVMSGAGFNSDDRFYLADCFDDEVGLPA
jgi:hypothetical protein